jgi:hypothetical protein
MNTPTENRELDACDHYMTQADKLQEQHPDNTFYVVELNDPCCYQVVSETRHAGLYSVNDAEVEHFATRIVYASGE